MSFAARPICLVVIAVALQLCAMCCSLADPPKIDPTVEGLLKQSAAAYRRLRSYQHTEVMKITVKGPLGEQAQVQKCILALQRPNQFAYKCNIMDEQEESVCDGKYLINYKSHFNTYTRTHAPAAYADVNLADVTYMSTSWMGEPLATCMIALLLQGDALANKDLAGKLAHAKIGHTASVDGRKADTLVCQYTAEITNTYYFDAATHRLLKATQVVNYGSPQGGARDNQILVCTTTGTLTDVRDDRPVDAGLLKYSPPATARLVSDFTDWHVDRNVEKLLKQSAAVYKKLKSYSHIEVVRITTAGPEGERTVEQNYTMAMKRPDRFVYKCSEKGPVEAFCDGKLLYFYAALSKEDLRSPEYAGITSPGEYTGANIADAIFQGLLPQVKYSTTATPQATCLIALLLQGDALAYKDETDILVNGKIGPAAMVDGKQADTMVCRYPGMPSDAFTLTFYFDAATHLLVKTTLKECEEALMAQAYLRQYASLFQVDPKSRQTVTVTEAVTEIKTDIPLAEDLFMFEPPADAKKVAPSAIGLINHTPPNGERKTQPDR